MNTHTPDQIADVLRLHAIWLQGKQEGRRADLRGAVLSDADLRGAVLCDADLRGAVLSDADLRGAVLSDAVLCDADLRGAVLSDADLRGAVLSDADLSDADLSDADLRRADLRGADLRGARNFPVIDPMPGIREKLLAAVEREECRIEMKDWHSCDTVHCLAGWAVTIHPQGRLLESILGTGTAAAMILNASGEKIPNFYDTGPGGNERAMNWLRTGEQVDPTPAEAVS